jgi:biotin synthase-like enzyme
LRLISIKAWDKACAFCQYADQKDDQLKLGMMAEYREIGSTAPISSRFALVNDSDFTRNTVY